MIFPITQGETYASSQTYRTPFIMCVTLGWNTYRKFACVSCQWLVYDIDKQLYTFVGKLFNFTIKKKSIF
jgi:hypothetical protein